MTTEQRSSAVHEAELVAHAQAGYQLVADVTQWPLIFPPCLAAEVLERLPGGERVRLWAMAGDEVRTWTSVRELDGDGLRVTFRQEATSPPLSTMAGSWTFGADPDEPRRSRLTLRHEWTATVPATVSDQITAALDHNSRAEVDAIRAWTERAEPVTELAFSFADQILIKADPRAVYTFLHQAGRWPDHLDHVASLDLRTGPETPGGAEVQRMEMETVGPGRTTHHSSSVRLCFPHTHIVYKQTSPPRGLLAHTGDWRISPVSDGCLVTAGHRVALDPAELSVVAGPGNDLAQARRVVRQRLGANSMRTLEAGRDLVEGRRSAVADSSG